MTRAVSLPELGLHSAKQIPNPAQRRTQGRPVHKVRICHDNRAYVAVPFTIPGTLAVGKQAPEWRADRDYFIAKVFCEVGRHDTATHPNDGTPSGSAIRVNVHRVKKDLSADTKLLASDLRIRIDIDHHQDVANDSEDGHLVKPDFNVTRLAEGDRVYVNVLQVGSSRPGANMVVTLTLVPIP